MRFAFLRRGNRRRTKVESAYAKSLQKKPCTVRPLFPTLARPYHGGGLLPSADSLRLTIEANAIRQLVPPEASEEERRQRRVTCRVLDIAVPEVRLQRPRVDAVLCQLEARHAEHMSMRLASKLAQAQMGQCFQPNPARHTRVKPPHARAELGSV